MADCLFTSGFPQDCVRNTGGLRRVYLANSISISTIAPVVGATADAGIITGITMASPLGVTASFYEFKPNKMSSKAEETEVYNAQNGTFGWDQTITLLFAKNEATKRNQVKLMAGADMVAIVEDFNGKFWYYGEFNGLNLTNSVSSTGTALADMNGWTLTLMGQTNEPAREIDSTIIAGLI